MSKWKRHKTARLWIVDESGELVATGATAEVVLQIIQEHNSHAALLSACKWISQLQDEHDGEPFENCMLHAERIALDALELAEEQPCLPTTEP